MSKKTKQALNEEKAVEWLEMYTGLKMYPYQEKLFIESLKHNGRLPRR